MKSTVYPTLPEAKRYGKEYRSVQVSRTILSDSRTPVEVLRALKAVSRHCFILESLEDAARWGRYTFLGYDPKLEFTCLDGTVRIAREAEGFVYCVSSLGVTGVRSEITTDIAAMVRLAMQISPVFPRSLCD